MRTQMEPFKKPRIRGFLARKDIKPEPPSIMTGVQV